MTRALRFAVGGLAVASLIAGCKPDTGFALDLDIAEGCAPSDIDQLTVTASLKPSGLQAPGVVSAPVFTAGHRRVMIIPKDGTTDIAVSVVASRGGVMVAGAELDVPVSGHQVLQIALSLGECVDAGVDALPAPSLTSISVTPTNPVIPVGANKQMKATGTYSDNSVADLTDAVTWASNAATVSISAQGGMIKGVMPGVASIKATLGTISGDDAVQVSAATLQSIEVSPANGSVGAGSTLQLTATGVYSDNTNVDLTTAVTWSASNGDATISANGLAAGVMVGPTVVTATLGTVSGNANLTVTAAMLASITITPANPSLAKGTKLALTATGNYDDNSSQDLTAQVAWSCDDAMVATVNAMGQARAVDVGTANIVAKLGKVSGTTPITVIAPTLMVVTVTPAMATLAAGTTGNFTASGMFSDGSNQDLTATATWGSSDANIASVSNANGSQGLATALQKGDVTINATFMGVMGSAKLSVGAATLLMITVAPGTVTLHRYTSQQFTAMGFYSDNTKQDLTTQVTWSSSDPIITISNAVTSPGLATVGMANANLKVTITATRGNVPGTATVSVDSAQLQSITVTPDGNFKLPAGDPQQYKAVGNYQDGPQDITNDANWFSGNTKVATIGNTLGTHGLLNAIAIGMTTIFTSFDNHNVQTNVEVLAAVLTGVRLSPAQATINSGSTLQYSSTALFSDNTTMPVTKSSIWSTSDMTIASFLGGVNFSQGLVTGFKPGMVTVTVTYMGKSAMGQLTVQ